MEIAMSPEHLAVSFTALVAVMATTFGLLPFYNRYVLRRANYSLELPVCVFGFLGSSAIVLAMLFYSDQWVQDALRAHFLIHFVGLLVILVSLAATLAALQYLWRAITKLQIP